jgi:penicillin-binding protein 2
MESFNNRQYNIQLVVFFSALVLLFRAAQLQIFDTSYAKRADAITIDKLTAYPSRGLIFDRKGKLVVNNFATYDLMATYRQVSPTMDTLKFCNLLGITPSDFKEFLKKDWKSGRFSQSVPFVFMKKIPVDVYARLQESLYEFPGFFVQVRNIRGYSYAAGAHALGYINEVSSQDIEKDKSYASGDYLGVAGIEARYETYLRGKKGANFLLKDNMGRTVGKYLKGSRDTVAVSGKDLITSLDIDLQVYGEELMQNKSGSIVAIEPRTGEILCMISAPTYDPNLLTMTQSRAKVYTQLLNDPLLPFFDRTVQAQYPPGSIFKPLIALVGLQEGTLYADQGIGCGGGYYYGGRLYKCHNHAGIGNVVDAVANSCNTYFFSEFRDIVDKFGFSEAGKGLKMFEKYAREFGLSSKLGIDYPSEKPGNIPTTEYYDKIYPKKLGGWRSPTIMSVGIGQGELQLTTLQMANMAACIANQGYWYAPHLAKEFKDKTPIPAEYREKHIVSIEKRYFQLVTEGMAECVNRGTARSCQIPEISVCGKTGTSQNTHGDDHSVFFAFAPKDNPKIAIAVYVENGTWGATYAAPIASLMIEKYIKGSISESRIPMEERMKKASLIEKLLKTKGYMPTIPTEQPIPLQKDSLPATNIPTDDPAGILPKESKKPTTK